MFIFLTVDCLKVAFFCLFFLDVELFFELNVCQVRINFDDIVPELFLLVVGLLDFTNGEV